MTRHVVSVLLSGIAGGLFLGGLVAHRVGPAAALTLLVALGWAVLAVSVAVSAWAAKAAR